MNKNRQRMNCQDNLTKQWHLTFLWNSLPYISSKHVPKPKDLLPMLQLSEEFSIKIAWIIDSAPLVLPKPLFDKTKCTYMYMYVHVLVYISTTIERVCERLKGFYWLRKEQIQKTLTQIQILHGNRNLSKHYNTKRTSDSKNNKHCDCDFLWKCDPWSKYGYVNVGLHICTCGKSEM